MKYGNGLSIKDVCALEVKECMDIMQNGGCSVEDSLVVADMISEAYYQFREMTLYAKKFDAFLQDTLPNKLYDKLHKQFYLCQMGRRDIGNNLAKVLEEELADELSREDGCEWYE